MCSKLDIFPFTDLMCPPHSTHATRMSTHTFVYTWLCTVCTHLFALSLHMSLHIFLTTSLYKRLYTCLFEDAHIYQSQAINGAGFVANYSSTLVTPAPVPTPKPSEVPTPTPTFSPDSLATGAPSPAPTPAPSVGELYLRLAPTAGLAAPQVYQYAALGTLAGELADSTVGEQIGESIYKSLVSSAASRRHNTYPAIDRSYVTVTTVPEQPDAVLLDIP